MTIAARKPYQPVLAYISKTISFDTPNVSVADTVQIGTLPSGATILGALINVTTAFNAATTNVIIVGTAADDDVYVAAGDVDETATGASAVTRALGQKTTADTPVYAQYDQTGTAATAGSADVFIWYAPSVV